jgi:hypothetical protein
MHVGVLYGYKTNKKIIEELNMRILNKGIVGYKRKWTFCL